MGAIPSHYHRGQIVQGRVEHLANFGAFVELEPRVDALCLIPNLSRCSSTPGTLPQEVYKIGEVLTLRIYVVDREKGKIGASEKAVAMSDEEFDRRFYWTKE
jgi:4-hydroxy-3-methylbut-2-enyl diphosphate reductase